MNIMLILVLLLVLASEFVNGWTDAPNAIATVVSTRVISPRRAVIMAVTLNVIGNLSGTAVAHTIGKGIIDPSIINLQTIAAALVGIVVWSSIAARLGIPTSESHALVSGLAGAGLATAGPKVLILSGWVKVFIGLILSSVLGFSLAWCVGKIIQHYFSDRQPAESKRLFDRLQIFSSAFMAYNHGMNDGQKFIGVFVMALVIGGVMPEFHVPVWVILLCAASMGLGTSVGGYKIISMIGEKMVHIESWQGFGAELAASTTIFLASLTGIPLSTTHTITTSLMGVAASRRLSAVRWKYSTNIVMAWVFTFPICTAIAFVVCYILNALLPYIS